MKYGPLKEIWLASYAPFYAFVVYRNRLDAQVTLKRLLRHHSINDSLLRMPALELMECALLAEGSESVMHCQGTRAPGTDL